MHMIINLLRRRLRDGDMHTYAIESVFYAAQMGVPLDMLRAKVCESLAPLV